MRARRRITHLKVEQLEKRLMLSCASAPAGLVACWSGDGNALDSQGTNDGSLVGDTSFAQGKVGQAFSFDGLGDYVQVPHTSALKAALAQSLTMSAWVMWNGLDADAGNGIIINSGDALGAQANRFMRIGLNTTTENGLPGIVYRTDGNASSVDVFSSETLTPGVWHHVAGVREFGNTVDGAKIYIDGVLAGSVPDHGIVYDLGSFASRPLSIGVAEVGTTRGAIGFFDGLIDEVEIYDRALSASEVEARYRAGIVTTVEIDVKLGSDPNSINVESNGQISVAVFTTDDFDATTIDVSSVIFAGAYAIQSSLEDVDGDGDLDMVLHFRTADTNLRELYDLLLANDLDADGIIDSTRQVAEVSLEGETLDDIIFQGIDEIDLLLRGKLLRELLDELALAGAI